MAPSWLTLMDDEEVIWQAHPSWYTAAGRLLLAVVVFVVGIVVATAGQLDGVRLGSNSVGNVVGFVLIVSSGGLVVVEYLRHRSSTYLLTSKRVFKKVGLVGRTVDPIRLDRVVDMEYQQSIVGRVIGVGDVRIMTAGTGGKDMVLAGVPSVGRFTNLFSLEIDRLRSGESTPTTSNPGVAHWAR